MYEDKTLVCKECGAEFVSPPVSRSSTRRKGLVNEPQRCKSLP